MAEISYNFSSIYIILIAMIYKMITLDFGYFSTIINSIYQLNSISIFLVINIIGLIIFLTKLKLQVYVKFALE